MLKLSKKAKKKPPPVEFTVGRPAATQPRKRIYTRLRIAIRAGQGRASEPERGAMPGQGGTRLARNVEIGL